MKKNNLIRKTAFTMLMLSAMMFSQFSVFADEKYTDNGYGDDGAGLETDVYYDYDQTYEWTDEDQQKVIEQIKAVQATKEIPIEKGFLSINFVDMPPNMTKDIKIIIYRDRNEKHTVYLTAENNYKDTIELTVGTYNSYKATSVDDSYEFALTPGTFEITEGQTTTVSMDLDTLNLNKEIAERVAKSELESKETKEATESNVAETASNAQNPVKTHKGFNFALLYLGIIPIGVLVFVVYYKFREND